MSDQLISEHTDDTRPAAKPAEHFDVLIVGAGISGVCAAYHMGTQSPDLSYVVLEGYESFGGTWWMHRYPGIRSDSDLHTFGYRFKPWVGKPIATAEEILKYMGDVIEENDLARNIRYRHKVVSAEWSSADNVWKIEAINGATGEAARFTANFLWMCQGYYRHSEGFTPVWRDMEKYKGRIVHPQTWPDNLAYRGKKVLVIGSGATAATVVPAIANDCTHVTMLQRSPTYFLPGRNANDLAETLRQLEVDESWVHEIVRRKMLFDQYAFTQRCFNEPDAVKNELLASVRTFLGDDYDIDKHFTPSYRPWRQRVAFIPDGDLFKAIAAGKVTMETDEIDRFTEKGILTKSGKELEADIVVTATGFDLCVLGGIEFVIDGKPLNFGDTVTYRGLMFTGVPNMAWVFGYFRASWTLRSDMAADFVCGLLANMKKKGARKVEVALRPDERGMERLPWIDENNFNPGYMLRGMHLLPKRLDKPEWQHTQDYWSDKDQIPGTDFDDEAFVYSSAQS